MCEVFIRERKTLDIIYTDDQAFANDGSDDRSCNGGNSADGARLVMVTVMTVCDGMMVYIINYNACGGHDRKCNGGNGINNSGDAYGDVRMMAVMVVKYGDP